MFSELIKKLFKVHEGHQARVLIAGATDKEHFENVFVDHGLENVTASMNENASKLGISYSPVFIMLETGKNGHIHANIALPLQSWVEGLDIDESLGNDLQRVTDWSAGFMGSFSMDSSVSAIAIDTGKVVFGDPDNNMFNIENIMKDIRPKKDKAELMADSMDIGSVEDILGGQLTAEEIETKTMPEKKKDMELAEAILDQGNEIKRFVGVMPPVAEQVDKQMQSIQQDISDKYGFSALQELLKKTGQPLLIEKPKRKKI